MEKLTDALKVIEFKIKFITPLLIHGENSRADTIGLTGKALRGCWRFWFRALIGGLIDNIEPKKLLELESKIFGSADDKVGAKFRIYLQELGQREKIEAYVGFKYTEGRKRGEEAKSEGYKEGIEYKITIIPRKEEFPKEILLSAIWLWANLGGVGQRARRGFGSPAIELIDKIANPFKTENLELHTKSEFQTSEEIKGHLTDGLKKVWQIFEQWIPNNSGHKITGDISKNDEPANANYFILKSIKQIGVGNEVFSDLKEAIEAIHGNHNCDELGWVDLHNNKPSKRMASPVLTRLYKVNSGFIPIITWCNQNGVLPNCNSPTGCVQLYLKKAKFDNSSWLTGSPNE
ncbi:MAG: type III-B CRISPR module RAMP protein Cmr1 [bacterium]